MNSVERARKWLCVEEVQKGTQMFTDKTDKWDESHPEFKVEQTKDGRFVKSEEVQQAPATCPDCDKAASHAYSDATTPGFFFNKCAKHREAPATGEGMIEPDYKQIANDISAQWLRTQSELEKTEAELTALQAHCERLRESIRSLLRSFTMIAPELRQWMHDALAATPLGSLAEHDREVWGNALVWAAKNMPATYNGSQSLVDKPPRDWLRAQAGVTNEQNNK